MSLIELDFDKYEGDEADWKAMYLHMSRALEEAIRILIKAQQECEEMYIDK